MGIERPNESEPKFADILESLNAAELERILQFAPKF
jgi:hypothetical protein